MAGERKRRLELSDEEVAVLDDLCEMLGGCSRNDAIRLALGLLKIQEDLPKEVFGLDRATLATMTREERMEVFTMALRVSSKKREEH